MSLLIAALLIVGFACLLVLSQRFVDWLDRRFESEPETPALFDQENV